MRSSASLRREGKREREREREGGRGMRLRQGRFQRDAVGCELLSSNRSLAVPLTQPLVCESGYCARPALGRSAAARAEAEADWPDLCLGCLEQRGV